MPWKQAAESLVDRRKFAKNSLVRNYLESAVFKEKGEGTRKLYRRVLEQLSLEHGNKELALLERRHIRKMRDARADTPAAAGSDAHA